MLRLLRKQKGTRERDKEMFEQIITIKWDAAGSWFASLIKKVRGH